ncbi:MAG TPA: TMEM175 family protein [Rubricoccaceae bacterium]|nr:TMEM175 family protein [Rubricoccaceae bacterium]
MSKGRLEAFSDAVIAILLTIMVLELRPPHGAEPAALRPLLPVLLSYVLSFVILGIYWNNHHHLLQATREVNGRVLWANLHLLFWLSLVPFATAWVGDTAFAPWPVALYGAVFLCCGVAYFILTRALLAHHGPDSPLAAAIGRDTKGKASVALYAAAIPLAFVHPWVSGAIYVFVAVMWLIPDRRLEPAPGQRVS